MRVTKLHNWALGFVAAATLTIVACKGTGSFETDATAFGVEGHIRGRWDNTEEGKSAHIDETRDGARVDIEFRDSNGNTIEGAGATGVGPGESVTVPAGATSMTVSGPSDSTSCSGCSGRGGVGGGGGMLEIPEGGNFSMVVDPQIPQSQSASNQRQALGHHQVLVEKWLYVFPLDASIDVNDSDYGPLSNAYASFDFLVASNTTASRLWGMVAPILIADMGNQPAVPSGITVNFFSKMVPNQSGTGARLYVADKTTQFQTFNFELNSSPVATLTTNSLVHGASFGWQVIEVAISATDFSVDGQGGSSNAFRIEADTIEGGNEGLSGTISYW